MSKKNFTITTVATAPSPATSGTSLVVATGTGSLFALNEPAIIFPTNNQPLVSNAEIVMVTNISSDTLTITRTQEGTSAREIVAGDIIIQGITAKDWNDLVTLASQALPKTVNITSIDDTGIANGEVPIFDLTNKKIKTSDKTITTTLGSDDTTLPTSKATKTYVDSTKFTWRGAWATTTAYAVNDTVEYSGSGYICVVAHTSGTFTTDLSNGKWEMFVEGVSADSIASTIHGATAKTTPVDADEVGLIDSAASNVLKKLTWSNIKATLKSYFDSVTTTLTNKTLSSPLFTGTIDGWISAGETWTYVSTDDPTGVIKINANVTSKYSEGMRFKMTNGGYTIYAIITKMGTYGGNEAGYTYITFLHEIDPTDNLALHLMANSAITNPYYSTQKAPQGFPLSPTKWSVTTTITSNVTVSNTVVNSIYALTGASLSVPVGNWEMYLKFYCLGFEAQQATATTIAEFAVSESSSAFTNPIMYVLDQVNISGLTAGTTQTYFGKTLIDKKVLTSKTTLYLIGKLLRGNATASYNLMFLEASATKPLVFMATCAYL